MSYSQICTFDILRSLGFASISATYAKLQSGSQPTTFAYNMRLICISNNTNGDMFVAFTSGYTPASDGTADQLFIPAGGFKLFDLTSNKVSQQLGAFFFNQGTQVWVRQSTAPTSGSIYLECLYGIGET